MVSVKEDGRPVFWMPKGSVSAGKSDGDVSGVMREDERSQNERGSSFQRLIKDRGANRHILSLRW